MKKDEEEELFRWEFAMAGRSPEVWAASGWPLIRSADILWQRCEGASRVWKDSFSRDEHGIPTTTGRRLTSDEIGMLGDVEIGRSALLLLGFGVENLAKSVLIKRDQSLVSDEGTFNKRIAHHDLVRLVQDCGVELTSDQRECLDVLSVYSELAPIWWTREMSYAADCNSFS